MGPCSRSRGASCRSTSIPGPWAGTGTSTWRSQATRGSSWDSSGKRFPNVRLATIETGSDWVKPLLKKLKSLAVQLPDEFTVDPVEIFNTNILPTMMASAAQGKATPKEAVASAAKQCETIYAKWRAQGLV